MVELRKRKTPPPAPEKPAKKSNGKSKGALEKIKDAITEKVDGAMNSKAPEAGAPEVGAVLDLADFGGIVETHDGQKVALKELVEKSKAGVVLFTYPKASTPGCK
jgi:thioredoxin-dependent peroxiredoxin